MYRRKFALGVAQQSLDSRLAAAAAASSSLAAATHRASVDNHRASVDNHHRASADNHRASVDNYLNNGPSSLSPYTKSTTVRRTSTSLVNINGEVSGGGKAGRGTCRFTTLCITASW